MLMKISVVINTLNEEENIAGCIGSVRGFADEVVVADMHSSDRTAAIAAGLGAEVRAIPRSAFVDPSRNLALSFAAGDWILVLDADERATPEALARLRETAEKDLADVVEAPFEVWMFGRRVRYSGWQDVRKKIFFKKGFLYYTATEVHAQPEWKGRLLKLPAEGGRIVHYNYRSIRQFVSKLNDYTDGEAAKLLREGRGNTPLKGVYWGFRHFLHRYISRSGYRDGYLGLMLSAAMGFYWFVAFCKAWEAGRREEAQ